MDIIGKVPKYRISWVTLAKSKLCYQVSFIDIDASEYPIY